MLSQTWDYDWLGNTSETGDDAKGFYDRSLGDITNDAAKPYQLTDASNVAGGGTRTGTLAARYDPTGNLSRLGVDRNGPCLPAGAACNQLFAYSWDEVGRLVTARRWDFSGSAVAVVDAPPPTELIGVTLQYAYDASDQRVIKSAPESGRHTVYLFESLELRRAQWVDGDYELTPTTEVAYLFANGVRLARLAYEPDDEIPVLGGDKLHVFFELGDHLGSTSAAIDKATGELVERRTYEAYGSTESDYRPERWGEFREDYGFTGKEEDVEVGLTYFGKRFLSTNLNRWVSADPLTIHGLGGDLNAYAYVSGRALQSVDPLGLNGEDADAAVAAGQKAYEAAMHAAWEAGKAAEEAARAAHEQGGTRASANFGRETARVALEKTATGRAKAVLDTLNPLAKAEGIVAAASDPKAAAIEVVKGIPVVSTVVAVHEVTTSLRARDADGFGTSIANGVLAVDDKAKELAVAAVSAGTAGAGRGVSNRPCPGNCFPAGTSSSSLKNRKKRCLAAARRWSAAWLIEP